MGPVNVGNPCEMSMLEIAQAVIAASNSPSGIRLVARPIDDPAVRRPDTFLIERELRWRPEVSWNDGLAMTISWLAARRSDESMAHRPISLQTVSKKR